MKFTKKSFLSIVLALLMLIACLATFGAVTAQNAFADGGAAAGGGDEGPATPPSDDPIKLCYISDTDPLVGQEIMEGIYPDCIYYIMQFDLSEVVYLAYIGYFDFIGEGDYDYLIFEIRTIKPNPDDLEFLFGWIANYDCKVIFVSNYELFEYSHARFMDYVYAYYKCANTTRLYTYVRNSVRDMSYRFDSFDSLFLLIDGRFIDLTDWDGNDILTLCERSEYLCYLLQHLCMQYLNNYTDVYNYREIARLLRDADVTLAVNVSENKFIYILDGNEEHTLTYFTVEDSYIINNAAMGMWRLEQDFYNLLYDSHYVGWCDLPVYILEIDPIEYDPDGLKIITDSKLFDSYGEEGENDINDFLAFLDGILK